MKGLGNLALFVFGWLLFIAVTYGFGLLLCPLYYFLVFAGAPVRAEKAGKKLQSSLMPGETVAVSGLQMRLYALFQRRKLVAATSSRIILITRSILGGFSMQDFQWKDLADAQIAENIFPDLCGARVTFHLKGGKFGFELDGLPSELASRVYAQAQAQEQAWEEKNRVRVLEEKRAASGSAVLNLGAVPAGAGAAGNSVFEDLERAKKLLDTGAISDAEFNEMKAKILNKGSL